VFALAGLVGGERSGLQLNEQHAPHVRVKHGQVRELRIALGGRPVSEPSARRPAGVFGRESKVATEGKERLGRVL
jgi:hypothetical protein